MGIITDSQNKKKSSSSSTSPCAKLRDAYHNCTRWSSERFVKGQWDKEDCVSEWQKYKACLAILRDKLQIPRANVKCF